MKLTKSNTGIYVYEGHNAHTVSEDLKPRVDLDTLKRISTVKIPDNLFVITLSEQNKSTMMARSDIITLLAFSNTIYDNDPIFNNFEYKEDKFHVNYLNVVNFKISFLLNFYQNLMDLKYYLENTSTQTSKNKIFQLLNSPVFKEKIENFKSKKAKNELFYPKDEFEKALEIAKDKLKKIIHKKGTEVEDYFEKQFNSNVIFNRNKDHMIFFITDLLFVYEEEEDLYLFPFFLFIIDDYLINKYGDDGLKDFGIESKTNLEKFKFEITYNQNIVKRKCQNLFCSDFD